MYDVNEISTNADIQAAIERAHQIRSRAMADALRNFTRWVFHAGKTAAPTAAQPASAC
jgi:hypothetical protein